MGVVKCFQRISVLRLDAMSRPRKDTKIRYVNPAGQKRTMALSNSVQESLDEASATLRNALAYAARQERTMVCTQIAKLLSDIESIGSFDSIFDRFDAFNEKD